MSSEFLNQLGNPEEIAKHPEKIYQWIKEHHDLPDFVYYNLLIVMCMSKNKAERFSALLSFVTSFQNRTECEWPESRSAEADQVAHSKLPFKEDLNNPVIYVAQDVMFIDENGDPIYKTQSNDKDEIKKELMTRLYRSDNSLVELVLRVGLAVGTSQQRGMSFYKEISFKLTSFTEEEIDQYVNAMSVELLKQTNGACRWEMPPFINHVVEIQGANQEITFESQELENFNFDDSLDSLALAVMAVYPEYLFQIIEAITFLLDEKNTEQKWITKGRDQDGSIINHD